MGLIKAATSMVGGGLADQWLEVIEPDNMSDTTVMTKGVKVRKDDKRGSNRKGTEDVLTDGTVVHVYPNMMMLLVDGGKIIDYTAEEEIKGIKFGTSAPLNYFDNFYNAELFLRAHGTYSIHVVDPILFYTNAIPKNKTQVEINDINEQYLAEFLTALQSAINQMSADGQRISYVPSKSLELSKYMDTALDDSWRELRGMEIVSVAVASISYTDDSVKLINMRNEGAMLGDPSVREGYVQGSIARGMEAAGKNEAGAMTGFMGVGMGMNANGSYLSQAAQNNQEQIKQQAEKQNQQTAQGNADTWTCPVCGTENSGKFCSNCGAAKPVENVQPKLQMRCSECNEIVDLSNGIPKFCPNCGKPFKGIPVD